MVLCFTFLGMFSEYPENAHADASRIPTCFTLSLVQASILSVFKQNKMIVGEKEYFCTFFFFG